MAAIADLSSYDQALQTFEARTDLLIGAGLVAFFRRYKNTEHNHHDEEVWRAQAVTAVGLRGELVCHPVTQAARSVVAGELLGLVARARPSDRLVAWGDLSPTMKRRIVESRMLPMEFKSIQRMDRLTVETNGDMFLLLGNRHVFGMLS